MRPQTKMSVGEWHMHESAGRYTVRIIVERRDRFVDLNQSRRDAAVDRRQGKVVRNIHVVKFDEFNMPVAGREHLFCKIDRSLIVRLEILERGVPRSVKRGRLAHLESHEQFHRI